MLELELVVSLSSLGMFICCLMIQNDLWDHSSVDYGFYNGYTASEF